MSAQPPGGSPPGLDLDALSSYLLHACPEAVTGPVTGRLIAGGRSNLTYTVTDGRTSWVLRRPPLGHVLETAHDMGREHRVMSALRGTRVPVPEMLVLCSDPDVIGAPFYVMTFVAGTVFRSDPQLASVSNAQAEALADQLIDVLVHLHQVDPAAVGLGELGHPEGFLSRQVRRWGKQLAASRSRGVPGLAELGERLAQSVPDSRRSSLVHGDFKLDNVVVGDSGRIDAVLDWEMATLGDPLTDLVNVVLWWDGIRDTEGHAFAPVPAAFPGFPGSNRLIERYESATGADLSDLPWYTGLVCYKLAAIFEGMHLREQQGLTVGEGFDRLAGLPPALAERGHAALDV